MSKKGKYKFNNLIINRPTNTEIALAKDIFVRYNGIRSGN